MNDDEIKVVSISKESNKNLESFNTNNITDIISVVSYLIHWLVHSPLVLLQDVVLFSV